MDSVYKNMQSSPYQTDQIHFGPYYPGAEAVPAQMHVHQPRPPVNYGYWLWGNNYGCGYASPAVCHSCCSHNYWPANHAWGSPYPHVPPFHCPGGYSIAPVPYMPPPFYSMEQARYEYEKNVPTDHHCCGCPNHPSHQKEHKNVRIEEEEPDGEVGENDSAVPFKFKNKPYPVVWLPPDFSNNKEYGKPNNLEDSRDGSRDVKPNDNRKTIEQQPSSWNGWYPLDLNKLVSSKRMGDGDKNHHQQDESKGHFPFPLFWMPYKPGGEESEGKESEEHNVTYANTRSRLESEKGSGSEQKFYKNGENVGGQAAHRAKDIPMKEVEQHEEKESPKNKVKESDAPVKDGIGNGEKLDNGEKKLPKDGVKRKSPSPPKSPKLPPVCLRVDPLPRKKGANGNSQSPSPPGYKQKMDQPSKEASKVSSNNNKPNEITNSEVTAGKGIRKTIDVVDGNAQQGDVNVETPINHLVNPQEHVSRNQTEEKPKEESVPQNHVETDDAVVKGRSEDARNAREKNEEKEGKADETKGSSERKLSEEEAAVIIQSAYRGFDIRRWDSIKKLKQIAKVREQMAEVKQLIQAMEASPDMQGDSKQRNIIAETIMSLLLKLDTIQGLHPSIREVRKSVVRKLVGLQEKLDSLMKRSSQVLPGEESIMRRDEGAAKESEDVKPSRYENGTESDLLEIRDQNHLEGGFNYEDVETKEANAIGDQLIGKLEELAAESSVTVGNESASEPTTENVDEMSVEVLENVDLSIAEEDHADLQVEQSPEVPLLPSYLEEAADSASTDQAELEGELVELPIGVLDDLYAQESTYERAVGADTSAAGPTEQLEGTLIEASITSKSLNDMSDKENKEQVELHELMDFPFSGEDVILDTNESLNNCLLADKYGAEDKVDNNIGDAFVEPEECTGQHPENVISDMLAAFDESEVPVTEPANSSEEIPETTPAVEMCGPLTLECAFEQESRLIDEAANIYEVLDIIAIKESNEDVFGGDRDDFDDQQRQNVEHQMTEGTEVKEAAEDKSDEGTTDSGDQQQENVIAECQMTEDGRVEAHSNVEVLSKQTQECNTELPKENHEALSFKDASGDEENAVHDLMQVTSDGAKEGFDSRLDPNPSDVKEDLNESNRKLIEENERLRAMLEKLIRSGNEQLTALSSLSGRVKDLEKKLSRKKKLKIKHYSASESPKQRTIGVAM